MCLVSWQKIIFVVPLRHQCDAIVYIYDVIGKGAWQTVYVMLRQLTLKTEFLSTETSDFLKQMNILVIYSVFLAP